MMRPILTNVLFQPNTCVQGVHGYLLDSMFDFAARLNALAVGDEEMALFSALILLASGERPTHALLRSHPARLG